MSWQFFCTTLRPQSNQQKQQCMSCLITRCVARTVWPLPACSLHSPVLQHAPPLHPGAGPPSGTAASCLDHPVQGHPLAVCNTAHQHSRQVGGQVETRPSESFHKSQVSAAAPAQLEPPPPSLNAEAACTCLQPSSVMNTSSCRRSTGMSLSTKSVRRRVMTAPSSS